MILLVMSIIEVLINFLNRKNLSNLGLKNVSNNLTGIKDFVGQLRLREKNNLFI